MVAGWWLMRGVLAASSIISRVALWFNSPSITVFHLPLHLDPCWAKSNILIVVPLAVNSLVDFFVVANGCLLLPLVVVVVVVVVVLLLLLLLLSSFSDFVSFYAHFSFYIVSFLILFFKNTLLPLIYVFLTKR